MRKIVFNGRDLYVRVTRSGRVEFRHPEDRVWFSFDGEPRSALSILTRLSPSALRTIADAKESPDV